MPRSMKMAEIKRILELAEGNPDFSNRTIGKIVGCSKDTVKAVLSTAASLSVGYSDVKGMGEGEVHRLFYPNNNPYQGVPEPDVEYCIKELKKPHVTVKLLHDEYIERHPNGLRYTQFKQRILMASSAKSITAHFERKPGERMEIDWSGDKVYYFDGVTGEAVPCYVFVAVVGRSGYAFMEVFRDTKSASFLTGVVHALEHFGGVPKFLVPDNDKSAVARHGRYEVSLNREFSFLADYYGAVVLPARVRKPKDKPLVENAVFNAAERNLIGRMHDKQFHSYEELHAFARGVLERFNEAPFSKKEGSRKSVFLEDDKPALRPLPKTPYELVTVKLATVNNNYHVEYKGFYYSVPYRYASRKVELRVSAKTVQIWHENLKIAEHVRLYERKGRYSTVKEHMPAEHQGMSKEKLISWGHRIHERIGDFLAKYFSKIPIEEQGYKGAQGIIDLSRKSLPRLVAAIDEADGYGIHTYAAVKTIFARMEGRSSAEGSVSNSNLRGPGYYKEARQ